MTDINYGSENEERARALAGRNLRAIKATIETDMLQQLRNKLPRDVAAKIRMLRLDDSGFVQVTLRGPGRLHTAIIARDTILTDEGITWLCLECP